MDKKEKYPAARIEGIQTTKMRWILFYIFATVFVIIVVCTLSVVFFGMGEPTEKERDVLFNVFIMEVGVAELAIFRLIFNLKRGPKDKETHMVNVDGKYEYELTCSDNKRFLGECLIKQEDRILSFNGERRKVITGYEEENVSIHWFSHWAELCLDNKIRLDYFISEAGGIRGYSILAVVNEVSDAMVGEVYLFNPDHVYGTLKLKKC
jgi:hypothetical protein